MTPSITAMERVLRQHFPDAEHFPLVRTLSAAAWELKVPRRTLLRTLKNPRQVLWYRNGKVYVPPDVYERWRYSRRW